MGWKPGAVKKEEIQNKIREEDAAKEAEHEAQVEEHRAEVRAKRPVSMQPDGDPKDAKGHTEGSMTQWMFTISNQMAEYGNILREIRTLLQTSVLQLNRGKVSPEVEVKPSKAELEKTAAEVLANNKSKNGKTPVVVDVPSIEVIAAQMAKYVKRHGKAALETRLKQYDVDKASKLTDEQKPLFLQDIAT